MATSTVPHPRPTAPELPGRDPMRCSVGRAGHWSAAPSVDQHPCRGGVAGTPRSWPTRSATARCWSFRSRAEKAKPVCRSPATRLIADHQRCSPLLRPRWRRHRANRAEARTCAAAPAAAPRLGCRSRQRAARPARGTAVRSPSGPSVRATRWPPATAPSRACAPLPRAPALQDDLTRPAPPQPVRSTSRLTADARHATVSSAPGVWLMRKSRTQKYPTAAHNLGRRRDGRRPARQWRVVTAHRAGLYTSTTISFERRKSIGSCGDVAPVASASSRVRRAASPRSIASSRT